ncbi:hypothetical protein QP760_12610 [Corynebacterium coyleae]|nr:hypothetical protein [Corynebacterium coyleae]
MRWWCEAALALAALLTVASAEYSGSQSAAAQVQSGTVTSDGGDFGN